MGFIGSIGSMGFIGFIGFEGQSQEDVAESRTRAAALCRTRPLMALEEWMRGFLKVGVPVLEVT